MQPLAENRVNAPATLIALIAIAAALLVAVGAWRRQVGRRQRAMRELLDSADALEARLRTARSEIEAVAGEHIDDPVQEAMREMLRQRLWLREHGDRASLAALVQVRDSIDQARGRIETQLVRIERARAPVA